MEVLIDENPHAMICGQLLQDPSYPTLAGNDGIPGPRAQAFEHDVE